VGSVPITVRHSPGKYDTEGQAQERADIAEHETSRGERHIAAAWGGTTGAGEMAEYDSDDAAGKARGNKTIGEGKQLYLWERNRHRAGGD
jgi:hypothetical protein